MLLCKLHDINRDGEMPWLGSMAMIYDLWDKCLDHRKVRGSGPLL